MYREVWSWSSERKDYRIIIPMLYEFDSTFEDLVFRNRERFRVLVKNFVRCPPPNYNFGNLYTNKTSEIKPLGFRITMNEKSFAI